MFHRFQIGTMAATIVSDGPLTLAAPAKIFLGPDPAELETLLTAAGEKPDRVRVEQNCLLIETGGKKFLFDNGLGSTKLYGPDSGVLHASLKQAGVTPDQIDAVVLTHAHSDHCWGTMADDGTPNFPNATLYLSQAELDFWSQDLTDPRMARGHAGFNKHIVPLRDRIQVIHDGQNFLPGIHAFATPGHTPGHMAFVFDGGWCLTGDIAFHDPISYTFPGAESVYDTDRALARQTRAQVLDRLAADRLSVVGYHHPWPGLGRVERSGAAFRFVPARD